MGKVIGAAVVALGLAISPKASAEEPAKTPPVVFLATGGVLTGLGVANLATAPLCALSAVRSTAQPACLATSIAFGVAFLGAGIPLIVVGAKRKAAAPKVGLAPVAGGAVATWSMTW